MNFSIAKTATLATLILSVGMNSAHAADWIEKVRVEKGGVDMEPINVRSNSVKYTDVVKPTHDFALDVYARAKSGKRVWYAELSSDTIAPWQASLTKAAVNEFDPYEIHNYAGRDVSGGTKRTWNRDITYRIHLNKIVWNGPNPSEACNALLAKKLIQGQPRAAILSQVQHTEAEARFFLRAAAARTAKAGDLGGDSRTVFNTTGNHWTDEGAGTQYTVSVRCLPSPNPHNQVQPQQPEKPKDEPNTVAFEPQPKSGDKVLKALPIIIGIGLLLAAGGSSRAPGR